MPCKKSMAEGPLPFFTFVILFPVEKQTWDPEAKALRGKSPGGLGYRR
jgi:hypothetical protein